MADIFLSHSSVDNDAADHIKAWLERDRESWTVFLDRHDRDGIVAGQGWQDRLRAELQSCRLVLAIITPAWLESRWCFAEAVTATFRGKDFIGVVPAPLPDGALDVAPPIVNERQRQALDLATGQGWQELLHALDRSGLDPSQWFALPPGVGPYPGFVAFEEKDAGVFFGRDQEITRYLDELALLRGPDRAQALVISGGSGSGKSSLLKAGLIPRLRQQPGWLVIPPFDPSREPAHALLSAIHCAAKDAGVHLEPSTLPEGAAALTELLQNDLRAIEQQTDAWLILPLDQAEVLLAGSRTQTQADANRVLDSVRELLGSRARRMVAVLTIRTEFMPALERSLAPAIRLNNQSLPPLTALSEVIEKPAARFGIELEPGLTGRMVEDTRGADALPLLAYTLHEIHERFGSDGRLTVAEYEQLGGVEGTIEKKLGDALSDPTPSTEELAAFRRCFVRQLVQVDEAAVEGERYLRKSVELDTVPPAAQRLVERLRQVRLLVGGDDGSVAIAHERLIRDWKRIPLTTWLEEDGDDRKLMDRLRSMLRSHQEGGPLLTGKPLLDAQAFLERDPALITDEPSLVQFIRRSITSEKLRVRRQKWLFRAAVAASMVFLTVAAVAVWFYLEAQTQTKLANEQTEIATDERDRAQELRALADLERARAQAQRDEALLAEARRLAANADNALDAGNFEKAIGKALESVTGTGETPPPYWAGNVETLLTAMEPYRDVLFTVPTSARAEVWLGGQRLLIVDGEKAIALDLTTGEITERRSQWPGYRGSVSPGGQIVAFSGEAGTELVHFAAQTAPVPLATGKQRQFTMDAAFGPDEELVAVLTRSGTVYLFQLHPQGVPRVTDRAALFDRSETARRVAISRDGAYLAALSGRGTVRHMPLLHEGGTVKLGEASQPQRADQEPIQIDGQTWLAASRDRLAFLYRQHAGANRPRTALLLGEIDHAQEALREALEPGTGSRPAAGLKPYSLAQLRVLVKEGKDSITVVRVDHGGEVRSDGRRQLRHPSVRTAAFDPGEKRIISTGRRATRVWNFDTPRRRSRELLTDETRAQCGSRVHDVHCDARRLSVITGGSYGRSTPTSYCIWDPELADPVPVEGDTSYSHFATFRADGRLVEVNLLKGSRFVDARTGKPVADPGLEPTGRTGPSHTAGKPAANGPGGFKVSYEDGKLRFSDPRGESIAQRTVSKPTGDLIFSPEGERVLTLHRHRTRVWRTASGELVDVLDHGDRQLSCATFEDERSLITVDTGGGVDRWRIGDFGSLRDMIRFAGKRVLGH